MRLTPRGHAVVGVAYLLLVLAGMALAGYVESL
jgi:hypothetical protein